MVAAGINGVLALLAGGVLVIPGELGIGQIVTYTLAMVLPAAVTLWAIPRYFPWIVVAVAVLTIPFPFAEFGSPVAVWLSAMHVIAGVSAAVIAPRVLALLSARQTAGASS